MDIDEIRQLLRDNPHTRDGYPQMVRDAVARYARRRRQDGAKWNRIETEVGVSATSMRKWMAPPRPAAFQEIVVRDEPADVVATTGLVIASPADFMLTGCTLEQAALVLRSLQ